VPTAEEWRSLAAVGIVELLGTEGAATQPGMEAKLSDTKYPGVSSLIHPHHLTTARNRLLAAGMVERINERTRGGQTVATFVLADPSKTVLRVAGRKRLLHRRYLSWSSPINEWGAAPIPTALERVIHRSLVDAAPHGYRLLRPEGGGEVAQIAGQLVPGGKLDNAVFHTGLGADGMPTSTKLMPIEAKNVRQWIYPRTQEMYQLLDKAARLRILHPDLPVMPIFVCRRVQFLTGKMAHQLGFHVIQTWRQYIRPAVAHTDGDARKFEELNTELAYNLELHEGSVEQMVNHFTGVIPKRCDEAATRWGQFVAHPDVPGLIHRMRDDAITNTERYESLGDLAAAARDVFSENIEWFHEEEGEEPTPDAPADL
jgi:hypothetical protein